MRETVWEVDDDRADAICAKTADRHAGADRSGMASRELCRQHAVNDGPFNMREVKSGRAEGGPGVLNGGNPTRIRGFHGASQPGVTWIDYFKRSPG